MPETTDLDSRIRELVARAVADAPPPPELDAGDLLVAERGPDRRRWWLAGGAVTVAVAAAAAIVAIVVVDDRPHTVTTDTTPVTPAPTTSISPARTTVPAPTVVVPDPSTTTTSTEPAPSGPAAFQQYVVAAGPDGVYVEQEPGLPAGTWLDTPTDTALAVGDGRFVVLPTGATTPQIWSLDQPTPVPFLADAVGQVRLHDVAITDRGPAVLYSVATGTTPDNTRDDLFVVHLDDASAPIEIDQIGGWEWGTRRLHLTADGLIVGESGAEVTHALFVSAIPGTPGAVVAESLTPAALGLEEDYSECDECPRLFTVDDGGRSIAWLDGGDLVIRDLPGIAPSSGPPIRVPLAVDTTLVDDIDLSGGRLAISYSQFEGSRPALVVPVQPAGPPTTPGGTSTFVTFGPSIRGAGSDVPPEGPTTPTTTTTTTVPSPGDEPVRLAVAGDGGAAVIEHGQEVRRLDQPAEIALLTPGGAVIFQAPRPDPGDRPGLPQIWRPDGSVEPFLSALPDDEWYRLHDVAAVGGIPTVLYGVTTTGPAPDQYTETVTALFMDPAGWRTVDVGTFPTYEAGISRLSLSRDGLVVGTRSESLVSSYLALAVPGTTAATWTDIEAPPSGVDAAGYVDCLACPSDFTVSADGESLVWVVDDEIRVEDRASGAQRSWAVPALSSHPIRSIDARTSSDGGVEVAISFGWPGQRVPDPVVVATSPPGEVATTPITGARAVTFAP